MRAGLQLLLLVSGPADEGGDAGGGDAGGGEASPSRGRKSSVGLPAAGLKAAELVRADGNTSTDMHSRKDSHEHLHPGCSTLLGHQFTC